VLACAALLHDTGLSQDALKHHKRSRDIILDAKLPDFTKLERKMAACVARYHRKAEPDPKHKHFRDLTRREQRVVTHLAALLRLADGLDRAHIGSVSGLTLENGRGVFRVEAAQRTLSPTDVWGSMRKRGLLEEVLGLPVEVHAVDPSPAAQRS
jgi:exopolyphosphatase/guanosine-5'-triphosphate,3'-diphosphate pyrophosphatase